MALCEICGSDYLRCTCSSAEPYCDTCDENDQCNSEMDSACVIYHPTYPNHVTPPSKLVNLGLPNNTSTEKVLEAIDDFLGNNANVPITKIDSSTILLSTSGVAKHTLQANLKISPDVNNQIDVRTNGVYAKPYNENYFVKVDATDVPDYLENQIIGGTDMISSISIINNDGLLLLQPTLNLVCLINALENNQQFVDLICRIKRHCDDVCADVDDINIEITT